jgi:hypothetical protein
MRISTLPGLCLLTSLLVPLEGRAQNLLINADFEAGNSGFSSAYTYLPPLGISSQTGTFTVGTDNQAFNPGFASSFGDHTSGKGRYQIIDGDTNGAPFWEQTISGLTPNRKYTFSFWLLNASPSGKAQIQASANGVVVGAAFTNPTDNGSWQLNTVTVDPGTNTQLTLRLRDLNTAANGNDFGIDDVGLVLQTTTDLTTSIAGPAVVGAGQAAGPYTFTYTNAGPATATQVTETVVLPTAASLTSAQLTALPPGATYNSGTRTISRTVPTVAAGASASFSFSFTAPPTTGSAALASTVQTTSTQNPNTRPDQALLTLTIKAAAPAPGSCGPSYATGSPSSGLSADFYPGYFNDNLGFFSTTTPSLTRIDAQLNYTASNTDAAVGWGNIIPPATGASTDPSTTEANNPELFSARHRGSVYIPKAGDYTFYLTSDDASDMWIDAGALVPTSTNRLIDNSGTHPSTMHQATVTLSAGLHNVLIYFGENRGGNVLTLEYSGPTGSGIVRQIVPNAALCAGASPLPPVASAVTNAPAMPNTNASTAIQALAGTDPNAGGASSSFIISTLPAATSGILYLDTNPVTAGQKLTSAQAANLSFDPDPGFVGNATFTFFAVNTIGQLSNLPATYTIAVAAPIADVATTLTGPPTLGAGISSGSYTVTFRNNGPQSATQVTEVVGLPTGASMSAAQLAALPGTATYSSTFNSITFKTVAVLPSGSTNVYTFSFTSPTTQGPNSLTSTVGTSTSQGADAAPNKITLAVTVTPANFFVTNDDSNEVPGNTTKSSNIILNDANPANLLNSQFTAQLVTGPTHGTVTLGANGTYSYTPASGYLGPDSFTYRINVPGTTPPNSNVSTVALNVYDASLVCTSGTGTNMLVNPSFTSGNTGFSSKYGYSGSGSRNLVPEGLYMVGANAHDYHPDFTGNGRQGPGDNFMIVNGSQDLSVVYQQTIKVEPNRYYTFSAYATSVNPRSPAELGFVINGKSTSTVTTLTSTVNSYVRMSDLWFSGSNKTAVIEIRDVNKVRGGNDFGLDDLYFGTCDVLLEVINKTEPKMPDKAPAMLISPLEAKVTKGPAVGSFTILTLPDPRSGILYLTKSPVVPEQVIAGRDANKLMFDPVAGYAGDAVFTYSATDNSGAGSSNIATFIIPVGPVAPLPVKLISFDAQAVRHDARLTWLTAQELNNDHFDVERASDGLSFTRVATVRGQGNTSGNTGYTFTDAGVGATRTGTFYYRLRQVDTDGTSSFSPVRAVAFEGTKTLAFYPNPTTGLSTLDLGSLPVGSYQVTLVDATGRQVMSVALPGAQKHLVQLDRLATGTYLLVVRGAGIRLSQRIVRN